MKMEGRSEKGRERKTAMRRRETQIGRVRKEEGRHE